MSPTWTDVAMVGAFLMFFLLALLGILWITRD